MVAVGTRVGPYEIVAPIGAGGMGEVWKARDTRLDRSVAIKFLPAELAQDAQFKLRFGSEARTISQLEHPHICRLYDVGDDYLVMELLEGESLEARIARGPMPLADVLKYGAQIAGALDRAHRAGIVHRDLKPGNVMITRGDAKLLDFGLARESRSARMFRSTIGSQQGRGSSPAIARTDMLPAEHDDRTELRFERPVTERGTILGTLQYMAPEQLDGLQADERTDIFALGALLYEMATGKTAFEGKSRSSLIAAIVDRTPIPISQLLPLTPPAFEHLVMKCLEKDPDERWQSAQDIAHELRWLAGAGSQAGVALPVAAARRRSRRWVIALAVAGWIAALAAAGVGWNAWSGAKERRLLKTEIVLPLDNVVNAPVAVSPDGLRLAAVLTEAKSANPLPSANQGESILAIRDFSSDQVRSLPGTEGAMYPFWSSDGSKVGFFAWGKLKTVTISSGTIEELCDAPNGRGGSWSPLGVIIFTPDIYSVLMRVPDSGGTPSPAVKVPAGVTRPLYRNPHFFPDGRRFFYTLGNQATLGQAVLKVGSLDGDVDRKVLDYGSNVALIDDWLITARVPNLIAQRFDSDRLELVGRPVAIGQNVDWYWARFQAYFAAGGSTLVFRRPPAPVMHLLRLDPGSERPREIREAGIYNAPRAAPDGKSVIVNRFNESTRRSDPWLFEFDGGTWSRITFTAEAAGDDSAVFAPDGKRIAIASSRNVRTGMRELWTQPVGGAAHQTLAAGADYIVATDWSRDGSRLLVSTQRRGTGFDIEVVDATRGGAFVPVVNAKGNEGNGRLSPDGRWLVYESDDSGRGEIYVTNFPEATARWQVSTEGGHTPYWSADGTAILFLDQDRIMTASVRTASRFAVDAPRVVEQMGDRIAGFSVSANGTIIALRLIEDGKPPLSVVTNWQKMLARE